MSESEPKGAGRERHVRTASRIGWDDGAVCLRASSELVYLIFYGGKKSLYAKQR